MGSRGGGSGTLLVLRSDLLLHRLQHSDMPFSPPMDTRSISMECIHQSYSEASEGGACVVIEEGWKNLNKSSKHLWQI